MSNKKMNNTNKQHERFTENCRYLGLKHLCEEYQRMVESANERDAGYYEFISEVVQMEAAAKRQRSIEYLIKNEGVQDLVGLGVFGTGFNPITGPIEIKVLPESEEYANELLKGLEESTPLDNKDEEESGK